MVDGLDPRETEEQFVDPSDVTEKEPYISQEAIVEEDVSLPTIDDSTDDGVVQVEIITVNTETEEPELADKPPAEEMSEQAPAEEMSDQAPAEDVSEQPPVEQLEVEVTVQADEIEEVVDTAELVENEEISTEQTVEQVGSTLHLLRGNIGYIH